MGWKPLEDIGCGFWTPLLCRTHKGVCIEWARAPFFSVYCTEAKLPLFAHASQQHFVITRLHHRLFSGVQEAIMVQNLSTKLQLKFPSHKTHTHLHRHQLIYPRPDPRRNCRRHPGLLRSSAECLGHRRQASVVANVNVGYLWAGSARWTSYTYNSLRPFRTSSGHTSTEICADKITCETVCGKRANSCPTQESNFPSKLVVAAWYVRRAAIPRWQTSSRACHH